MPPLLAYMLASVAGLLGAGVLAGNYKLLIRWYVYGRRGSLVPLLGGLLLTASLLLCPTTRIRRYAWSPIIIDPGYLYLFAHALLSKPKPKD
jgi:hypothetical protein